MQQNPFKLVHNYECVKNLILEFIFQADSNYKLHIYFLYNVYVVSFTAFDQHFLRTILTIDAFYSEVFDQLLIRNFSSLVVMYFIPSGDGGQLPRSRDGLR